MYLYVAQSQSNLPGLSYKILIFSLIKMHVDTDTKERIKIFGTFMLQSYKVVMGTMLSLFVAQKCENDDGTQLCKVVQNRDKTGFYPNVVLYFNGFTLLMFSGSYCIELLRENWCVKHFDIEPSVPDTELKETLKDKHGLKEELDFRNKMYFKMIKATGVAYFINVLLSAKLVFSEENDMGSATKTGFMSFVLLVTNKLWSSYSVAKKSSQKGIARSAYMREYTAFNILDRSEYPEVTPDRPLVLELNP